MDSTHAAAFCIVIAAMLINGPRGTIAKKPELKAVVDKATAIIAGLVEKTLDDNKGMMDIPVKNDMDVTKQTTDGATIRLRLTRLYPVHWRWEHTFKEAFECVTVTDPPNSVVCRFLIKSMAIGLVTISGAKQQSDNRVDFPFNQQDLLDGQLLVVTIILNDSSPTIECKNPKLHTGTSYLLVKDFDNVNEKRASGPLQVDGLTMCLSKVVQYGCKYAVDRLTPAIDALYK